MFLTRAANLIYDACLTLLYPQSCAICSGSVEAREFGVVCGPCWQGTRLLTNEDVICWKCGALSGGHIADEKREQVRCHRCDDDAFSAARACGSYEGALRASILALKREPFIPRRLVALLKQVQQRAPLNQANHVIPVPLHPEREKVRGFNQAAVIGRELARAAALPVDEVSLVRTVHSRRHRAGMDAKGRHASVAQAFKVRYPRLIEDERILLVDDVFTTGATVSSCASALLEAGAREVFVLTIARPY
ncbi:MAG TPA: ComF family protein [Pyrinomonadaceae bacterium]|nr:ComF family protein [Pyrinomonadaceae bacterium]